MVLSALSHRVDRRATMSELSDDLVAAMQRDVLPEPADE
jgi:hypothetical protein